MTDLVQLQNLCKRDPPAYKSEFLRQWQHFQSQLQIFQLKPSKNFKSFLDEIKFISSVASCYRDDVKALPGQLAGLLESSGSLMEPDLRKGIVKALILLRNRNLLSPTELLALFFKLFRVPDKQLRKLLYSHIVSDIKKINAKHRNNKLNTTLQNFMFTMMQDPSEIAAKKSLDVMVELYHKRIWNDAKTVNCISGGVFYKDQKIMVASMQFFLGNPEEEGDDDDDEHSAANKKTAAEVYKKFYGGSKRTRGKKKKMEKALATVIKNKGKKKVRTQVNFPALELIYDPQTFTERLMGLLKSSSAKFDVRLMLMNLISRMIATHKLLIDSFYPFLQKYLQPKQEKVTYILAVLAQSCHDLVLPETLSPMLKAIADNFVSDRSSNEAVSVGLNTIREICSRCPLVMEEDLMRDLAQYRLHRDKSVVMAARALINLFRTVAPNMLHKKDRGKGADLEIKPLQYGEVRVASDVDGIELLIADEARQQAAGELAERDEEAEWQMASDADDSDGSGEWIDVSGDDELASPKPPKGKSSKKPTGKAAAEEGSGDDDEDEDEDEDENEDEDDDDGEDGWVSVGSDEEESDDDEDDDEEGSDDDDDDEEGSDAEDDEGDVEQSKGARRAGKGAQKKRKPDGPPVFFEDVSGSAQLSAYLPDPSTLKKRRSSISSVTSTASDASAATSTMSTASTYINRILTPKDLERLAELKAQRDKEKKRGKKDKKRISIGDDEEEEESTSGGVATLVAPEDIERFQKRQKQTYEERRAHLLESREERPKFDHANRRGKAGGTTNEQKQKAKPFMLAKFKREVQKKKFRSNKDKQKVNRAHATLMKRKKKFKHF
eukprot:TRINITY_DN6131_c0_g3_i1.p1 TRINITY_DN6131_c0_g3~~TRINITY_DN6131_c0_g3_i1.p1  ORF type:complete len:836 (-),score=300.68 TRINITY_DN6131_c0_g3_i1:150-2657(-)